MSDWVSTVFGLFGVDNPLSHDTVQKVLGAVDSHGLGSILDTLKANGRGGLVDSWLSTGPNPDLSSEGLIKGVGLEKLKELADRAGLPSDQFIATLSKALPSLVDKLSPEGTLQESGWLEKGLELLKSKVQ